MHGLLAIAYEETGVIPSGRIVYLFASKDQARLVADMYHAATIRPDPSGGYLVEVFDPVQVAAQHITVWGCRWP